jgi:EAL domain-containing protein (putative c-di-GMP-specific phosphodiesterase class I)
LKIDKLFVDDLGGRSRGVVQAVVDLARAYGPTVTAEGIEDPGCAEELARLGCHLGQGFLFVRPGPLGALLDQLRAQGPGLDEDWLPEPSR